MIQYLQRGITAAKQDVAGTAVKTTVESMLKNVRANGDQAIRQYSEQFDHWSPASFKFSEEEIQGLIASLPAQVIHDLEFAQIQIDLRVERYGVTVPKEA